MTKIERSVLVIGLVAFSIAMVGCTAKETAQPSPMVQNIDQATLQRYHHTDQGTRIMPAAFLASLKTADGSGKVMSMENMRKWGFLVENATPDPLNPYGWPVGFTVSDPAVSRGIP